MSHSSSRVAIVTGGGSGIGAATARLLAASGDVVYCADIDAAHARRTAEIVAADGGTASALTLDVTSEAQWAAVVAQVMSERGRVDVLVNSAGISHAAPVTDITISDWRRVFAVNVDGVFLGTRAGVAAMRERGGAIVNVTSASGIRAAAGASAYSASKAAVAMFTRAVAKECRERVCRCA